jgi:hypothetical protein
MAYLIVAVPLSTSTIAPSGCKGSPPFSGTPPISANASAAGGRGSIIEEDDEAGAKDDCGGPKASMQLMRCEDTLRGLKAFQRAMKASGKIGTKPMQTAIARRAWLRLCSFLRLSPIMSN